MATSYMYFPVVICCSTKKPSISQKSHHFKTTTLNSAASKPLLTSLLQQLPFQLDVQKAIKNVSSKIFDEFVDMVFEFVDDEPATLQSQKNFVPLDDQLEEAVEISSYEGTIPADFPVGAYLRNGSNPLFGGLKAARSMFGQSGHIWVEGEGMIHALYLDKDSSGNWTVSYNNRHAETETFLLEKQRNKPAYLPATVGDPPALLAANALNMLRFGKPTKYISNTNVFEHAGKVYSIAENHMPHEIDISTLHVLGEWDLQAAWNRPCTSHPKRVPGTGELVIHGIDAVKPYLEVGVISADGKKLLHKTDIRQERSTIFHELGITQQYNVILDLPITVSLNRLFNGGPFMRYDKDEYARIGVMPRYGDGDSVKWFDVKTNSTFHILNCFEEGDEVVVMGCRSLECIIPGPDRGLNKFEWFSKKMKMPSKSTNYDQSAEDGLLFTRVYEWRLNMQSGKVKEKGLTGVDFSMDFPVINPNFVGLKNKYGYTQVVDSDASTQAGIFKYGGLAKLYLEKQVNEVSGMNNQAEDQIMVEHHMFEENTFCSGVAFVAKEGCVEEDDGWIITFVHNEDTNLSQVHVIDTKKFSTEPVAKITIPCRVPYGFHDVVDFALKM